MGKQNLWTTWVGNTMLLIHWINGIWIRNTFAGKFGLHEVSYKFKKMHDLHPMVPFPVKSIQNYSPEIEHFHLMMYSGAQCHYLPEFHKTQIKVSIFSAYYSTGWTWPTIVPLPTSLSWSIVFLEGKPNVIWYHPSKWSLNCMFQPMLLRPKPQLRITQ